MSANKYAAPCHYCAATVPAKAGRLWKAGRHWNVAHVDCGAAEETAEENASYPRGDSARVSDHYNVGGRDYYRNKAGTCEDAPCCGCCTI